MSYVSPARRAALARLALLERAAKYNDCSDRVWQAFCAARFLADLIAV
jgi:hypothetical protein